LKGETRLASESPDLFGADPGSDPLAYYAADADADLYLSSPPEVAGAWRTFVGNLARQAGGELAQAQVQLDRHVEELGLAYRLTGDEKERPWPLGPIPILIGGAEWARIEEGLVQRAELLEAVVADIYGAQALVTEGHLPAAMVSGSPHFARRMVGLPPRGGHHIKVCAIDLARGPTGEWRVLADRVRLTVGIGYALENRQALARATGGLLASINTRRQSDFFESLREGIAADCARIDPRIALLTPGRFNQSYPEQAHLARHLGFSLVEGRDLAVREGRLFVRTIAGLKRIDALWRWINTRDIDPLNFDTRSRIGVPGLLSACESGQLAVANWMGAGVVESRAMSAFMPALCRRLLGEPLKLPNAATWWCGGPAERDYVLENLDRLVLSSSFRTPVALLPQGTTRSGASLSEEERTQLREAMARRAMDYSAQEIIHLSTTPCVIGNRLEPRSFTVRAYLARDARGRWQALPGGLGRVSQEGDLRTSLMGLGDLSCDVCIVDPDGSTRTSPAPLPEAPPVRRAQGLLPSQAADNLYWLGRYAGRCNETARAARALLEEAGAPSSRADPSSTLHRLAQLLSRWGAIGNGTEHWRPVSLAEIALGDAHQSNSIASLDEKVRSLALLLRDRLSGDAWRALGRPLPQFIPGSGESMIAATDALIERYAALMRLIADTMSRSDAWRFLDLGHCLERASLVLQAVRVLVPTPENGGASGDDLSALLDLNDAQALYRSRYLSLPFTAPVIDLVLLDPLQPRGLIFQTRRIVQHLEALPGLRPDGRIDAPLRLARQLFARIEGLEAEAATPVVIDELTDLLAQLSNAIGRRFFLQDDRPQRRDGGALLA
jgi:uncharacterized circularly permuted ATP-grasp superfamily protein/uncharacterized alpha-E superfamily protein